MSIELEFKRLTADEAPQNFAVFNCVPDHRLIDVIQSFLEFKPFSIFWFEFYDSHLKWLGNTEQTIGVFLKTNSGVIYYKKKVPLKFRVLQDPQLINWCINHGFKIDNGPIPEIGRICGFDIETELKTVCEEFGDKNGFTGHRLNFFNSDGEPIFQSLPWHTNLANYFKLYGPLIFYTYDAVGDIDYFYLNASHNPHSVPKRIMYSEGMTVDLLSRTYKHQHSSLMAIENGNIVGFVDPNQSVEEILDDLPTYRLGDLYDSHSTSEQHFDVSVQFKNGGDKFMNPVLVCAMDGETINKFSKRLLEKMVRRDQITVCLKSLQIKIDDEDFKCNSTKKIYKPATLNAIPVYFIDARHMPVHLKYCDYEYEFYFYDKTKPCDRFRFIYTKVIGRNPEKITTIINRFVELKEFTIEKCKFFDSRDVDIDLQEEWSTVGQYARKNDLVFFYVNMNGNEDNNTMDI